MTENDFELVRGSGNVFRDFNDPHADLKQARAILAARIIAVLDECSLMVCKAASLTGFAALDSRIRVTVHVASEPFDPSATPLCSG